MVDGNRVSNKINLGRVSSGDVAFNYYGGQEK